MKRLLDRKISDKVTRGYNAEEIQGLLSNTKEIDNFEYYYYRPKSKFPAESKRLKNQPTAEVLSFLNTHFTESLEFYVETQQKTYKSGRKEIILRGIDKNGEITKIAVLNLQKNSLTKTKPLQ